MLGRSRVTADAGFSPGGTNFLLSVARSKPWMHLLRSEISTSTSATSSSACSKAISPRSERAGRPQTTSTAPSGPSIRSRAAPARSAWPNSSSSRTVRSLPGRAALRPARGRRHAGRYAPAGGRRPRRADRRGPRRRLRAGGRGPGGALCRRFRRQAGRAEAAGSEIDLDEPAAPSIPACLRHPPSSPPISASTFRPMAEEPVQEPGGARGRDPHRARPDMFRRAVDPHMVFDVLKGLGAKRRSSATPRRFPRWRSSTPSIAISSGTSTLRDGRSARADRRRAGDLPLRRRVQRARRSPAPAASARPTKPTLSLAAGRVATGSPPGAPAPAADADARGAEAPPGRGASPPHRPRSSAARAARLACAARAAARRGGTIRVDLDRIDRLMNLVGEIVITSPCSRSAQRAATSAEPPRSWRLVELGRQTREMQDNVMADPRAAGEGRCSSACRGWSANSRA